MMRFGICCSILLLLAYCTPKGPQTFESAYVGKTKEHLISTIGPAHKIKVFDSSEAYIYVKKEEYYGRKTKPPFPETPKCVFETEFIYYINSDNIIYKYQVWKKKLK